MKISILGGTGYVGSHIAAQAVRSGEDVTVVARSIPNETLKGVEYKIGDVTSAPVESADDFYDALLGDSDVVVVALSPRGAMAGKVLPSVQSLAAWADSSDTRLIVIGGFSAMRLEAGGPRIAEMGKLPDWLAVEAKEMASIVDWLEASAPRDLAWLYVSPAQGFGPKSGTPPAGHYVVGDDVSHTKNSTLAVEDLALGVVDEIRNREHSGHISLRE